VLEEGGEEGITLAPVLEGGDDGRVLEEGGPALVGGKLVFGGDSNDDPLLEEGGPALVGGKLVFGGDSNDEFCPSACPKKYIDMKIRSTIVRIEADLV
jgi:hypothetical protein